MITHIGTSAKAVNSSQATKYLFFATAALIMFYYAHAEWLGVDKAFYIPCGLALVFSFLTYSKRDYIDTLLAIYIFFMLMSDILTGFYPNAINAPSIRIILGILCFNKIRKLDLSHTITYLAKLSPFIIITYYIFANPFKYAGVVRYGGFSGDPNFLAISLELLIGINLIFINTPTTKRIWKISCITAIIGTIPLFIAGQSRMGLISLMVMFLCYFHYLLKKSKKTFIILCITGSLATISFYTANQTFIEGATNRFTTKNKADVGAATTRLGQIDAALHVLNSTPECWISGIGIDHNPLTIADYSRMIKNPVHNTFVSVLFQQGIISLLFFCLIIWHALKIACKKHRLYLGLFIALMLNISSVPSINYLTFWWSLFFIMNDHTAFTNKKSSHALTPGY